jgi:SAM-dependent methyltransferase
MEQAVRVGNVAAIAHVDLKAQRHLTDRLSSRGYEVQETPHFMVCRMRSESSRVIIMHTFDDGSLDADLFSMIPDELAPLGVATSASDYGDTVCAIVASTRSPLLDVRQGRRVPVSGSAMWRSFWLNTLDRLRTLLAEPQPVVPSRASHIVNFATMYRRIMKYCTGTSLLDVGSSLGFLPVLVAENFADMTVVGCDSRHDLVACASDLAGAIHPGRVLFLARDVLSPEFREMGRYDTVTAVHLLEHVAEQDVPAALSNMLDVTCRRLIIAVPYEERVLVPYGHAQAFTPEKLRICGRWCVEALGGGQFWCEDLNGGLLVFDRPASGVRHADCVGR